MLDNSPLPLRVVPAKDEPAHGILLRLAERNGLKSSHIVSKMTGLSVSSLRAGVGTDRLASLIRCEPESVMRSTFQRENQGFVTVRGERLNFNTNLMQRERRVCPHCVASSAHHRFWWDFSFITTCPEHAVNLVEACSCGSVLSWKDGTVRKCLNCVDGDVMRGPITPSHPNVLAMDRWALGRFGVGSPVHVPALDVMSATNAIRIIYHVGALKVGGYRRGGQQAPAAFDLPVGEVRAAGFDIIRRGMLDDVMDAIYAEYLHCREHTPTKRNMPPNFRTAYGWFGAWFKVWHRSKHFEERASDFANAVIAHASRNSLDY